MIKTAEALRTARGLLGTSYDELDCINLIKKVIRVSAGGEKSYTTAGTNALWESDANSAKYRDLTWKQEGISGAKAGMLAFMGVGTGDVNHVGLVTEKGTVVHSSKSRGGTVETELTEKNGWNGLGKHRMIEVNGMEKEFGNATVSVTSGCLNIREAGGTGWVFGKLENGVAGYMAGAYLVEDENTPDADAGNAADAGGAETTTFRRSDGVYVTLAGKWTIAED